MYDLTAQQLALRLAALLILIALQGGAIALGAWLLGDKGPQHDGRATLNPLPHLDVVGLASGVLFLVPWMKPLAIDARALRGGAAALLLPLLAGSAAVMVYVLLLAPLRLALLPYLSDSAAQTLFAFVETAQRLGAIMAVTGLLPLPPFAGALLIRGMRPDLAPKLDRLHAPAGLVVLLLGLLGWLERPLAWIS